MKVAAFTSGSRVPSARFRVRQYGNLLRAQGIELEEHSARLGAYPPLTRWVRPLWGTLSLAQRVPGLIASHSADVTLLQRELISTLATLEGWSGRPRLLDVDDAIWLNSRGNAAGRIAAMCDGVICGNAFLADWFSKHNKRITIIATGVDTDRFAPATALHLKHGSDSFVIGWSGSHTNQSQLEGIQPALARVLRETPGSLLLVTSNRAPHLPHLPADRVVYLPWSEANEVATIQAMDVGLMPLEDTEWNRGKCSYKMLLYMACGLPVIVAPVGMNSEVLDRANIGFGATNEAEWVDALRWLAAEREAGIEMGRNGRMVIEEYYSTRRTGAALARVLLEYGDAGRAARQPIAQKVA